MKFSLTIHHNSWTYQFQVERFDTDKSFEMFRIMGGANDVVLRNNCPLLRARGL